MNSFDRLFELFLIWCKKTNKNYNVEWLYTKNKVYMDGEDKTDTFKQWLEIKLPKGETAWLKELEDE